MNMSNRPLSGIRIVDGVAGPLAMIGRYLADLGAEIDRFVPADVDGAEAIVANAGKRCHAGDMGALRLRRRSRAHTLFLPVQRLASTSQRSAAPAPPSSR